MTSTTLLRKPGVAEKAVEMQLHKAVAERKASSSCLENAWDVAAHTPTPDATRSTILHFAHDHGLTEHLPKAAQTYAKVNKMRLTKATNSDMQNLFELAWNHEDMEGDTYQKRQLVRYAEKNNLSHMLPEEAHGLMHDMGVQHKHDGIKNDAESGLHHHTVTKAFNPKGYDGVIIKSWVSDDGVHFEGWNATPRKDLEKDITEPEAFIYPMDSFFARAAPLSIEHNGKSLPVGHLQKAAVVRDGKILKETYHPSDPAEFENFPGIGTGMWVRGIVNEEPGMSALRKGNVRGMSFIANAVEIEPLPGGRYRYLKLDPWIESTIAAYPVNPDAVIAVAKAFGLTEPPTITEEEHETMPRTLDEIIAEAAREVAQDKLAEDKKSVTAADLGNVLGQFKESLLGEVKTTVNAAVEEVKKAIPDPAPVRGEGVGRKGQVDPSTTEDPREADPLNYIVAKASKSVDSSAFDEIDMALLNAIIYEALADGLKKD